MKKAFFLIIIGIVSLSLFAQLTPIGFRVSSYQISTRQIASQYTRAELLINDENQSWEIILHRREGNPDRIKLENYDDIGRGIGVFRSVTITEASGTSGSNLFAYMPAFEGNRIRVDLCDKRTEGVRRRLIMEIIF